MSKKGSKFALIAIIVVTVLIIVIIAIVIGMVYSATNHAQEIVKGLFLGPLGSAKNKAFLKGANIRSILTVMDEPIDHHENIEHKFVNTDDYGITGNEERPHYSDYFQECIEWIDERLKHGNVLIHCRMGINRSASMVILYLMAKNPSWSYRKTYNFVKAKRRIVQPFLPLVLQVKVFMEKARSIYSLETR